jgi:hypothetical protein
MVATSPAACSPAPGVTAANFAPDVESSNSSGYDQVIDHVTLTIKGIVGPIPAPGTMTILGSGLGMLFFVVRRRKRTR